MANLSEDQENLLLNEEKQLEVQGTDCCILCGASSFYNYHKPTNSTARTTPHWSTWRSDSGQSLFNLLSLSGSAARRVIANGPYCLQCSCLVWDIHFTMTQLKTLEQRLRSLKMSVEDKIKLHPGLLQDHGGLGKRKQSEVAKLIAKASKKVSSGNGRNECSIDFRTETDLENFKGTKLNESDNDGDGEEDANGLNQPSTSVTYEIKQEPDWCPELEDIPTVKSDHDEEFGVGEPSVSVHVSKLKRQRRKKGLFGQKKKRKLLQPSRANAQPEDQQKSPPKNRVGRPRKKPRLEPESLSGPRLDGRRTLKEPKICPICSIACPNKKTYSLHVEREHPSHVYRCPACSGQYKRELILEWHIKHEHGGRERLLPFYCSICWHGFETQPELTQHEEIHKSSSNPFICSICKLEVTNSLALERHVRTHDHPFKCTHAGCEKTFRTEASWRSHVGRHTRPFICETCGQSFPFRCELTAHVQRNHPVGDPLVCHVCARIYKSAHDLLQHIKSHAAPKVAKRYPCRVCEQEFVRQYARKKHEEVVHSGTKTYECPICGKKFRSSANLNNHKYKVHDPDPVSRERKRIRNRLELQTYARRKREREMGLEHNSS